MKYNENELYELIIDLGVNVQSQTHTHYLCLCPFHENHDSAAFEISKENGLWLCFNHGCGAKGNLPQLVERLSGEKSSNFSRVMRLMGQNRGMQTDVMKELAGIFGDKPEREEWDEEILEKLRVDYDTDDVQKLDYLLERGFAKETLRSFEVGYSALKKRIVVPVRTEDYRLVGVIGRTTSNEVQPRYLYSDNMPKKDLLFNLCRAKTFNSVIIVEGSLDCMRVHQAGFPNVVAVLGSAFSDTQASLVNKYFLDVIIFGDNDDAGHGLGKQIEAKCPRRNLYFAEYPEGKNDPGEMNTEEITWALENKSSQLERLFLAMKN